MCFTLNLKAVSTVFLGDDGFPMLSPPVASRSWWSMSLNIGQPVFERS